MSKARPNTLAALGAILVAVMGATVTVLGAWHQQLIKAAWLPTPYLLWVAFAGYLNLAVVRLYERF
jgi:tryptophan-rich sensory protein